jgi:hypothetical protein
VGHSLVVIGLAPSHPVVREGKTVTAVDFGGGAGKARRDLAQEHVHGKHKQVAPCRQSAACLDGGLSSARWAGWMDGRTQGALQLTPESILCRVVCADGSEYRVRCCVRAKLLEVNTRLSATPQLVQAKPATDGYVAIVQPATLHDIRGPDGTRTTPLLALEAYQAQRDLAGNSNVPFAPSTDSAADRYI